MPGSCSGHSCDPTEPLSCSHLPFKTQLNYPHLREVFPRVPRQRNVQALSLFLNSWPASPCAGCCWGVFSCRALRSYTLSVNTLPTVQSPDVSSSFRSDGVSPTGSLESSSLKKLPISWDGESPPHGCRGAPPARACTSLRVLGGGASPVTTAFFFLEAVRRQAPSGLPRTA